MPIFFRTGDERSVKVFSIILISTAVLFVCAGTWMVVDMHRFINSPANTIEHQATFIIRAGETFNELTSRLKSKGIIASTIRFKLYSRMTGSDKQLKAGEYRLSATMTPGQILDMLVQGRSILYRLTIPEGFTIKQIAQEIARQGLGSAEDIHKLATDPLVAQSYALEAQTLEGYLFPDTYYFPKHVDPRNIITKMVERFKAQFHPAWEQRANKLNFSVHQIVTLASIIEKETGAPSERPIIASVFHNRLKKKMRLESDPTVIYGIPNFDGNIKRHHLQTRTPYNTYKIRGLPPGPIANPGSASIKAALYPHKTDFLYFVAKKDGTHHFSTNINDHNRAVSKYQLR
jgi:UPF0755 protein